MKMFHQHYAILLVALISASGAYPQEPMGDHALRVTVGKSLIIDGKADIVRVAVGAPAMAEAVPINAREVLVNGLMPGETSLVVWESGGARQVYDLSVRTSAARLDAVRLQLATELGDHGVTLELENEIPFLRGRVKDMVSAERAVMIAGSLGKVVNLLYVDVPPVEAQILLRVRFINVERSASRQLGLNLISSTGQLRTPGSSTTGQFSLGDVLNLLLVRKDFNLTAVLTALANDNLVEILAEPNLLAIDGQTASFVAGGEFPYPTVQGGGVAGAVTIAFREFGVRLKFLPKVTPRGTVRLHVAPEVSSLDFANGLQFQGFNIPALVSRKIETEVELESGQSFVIAGLLDQRLTDTLSKVPGIGSVPILGRLFQTRTSTPTNSELLVVVTPELVRPIPVGAPVPDLNRPKPFPISVPNGMPRTPGVEITGPPASTGGEKTVPVEQLQKGKEVQPSLAVPQGPVPRPPAPAPASQ